MSDKKVGDFAWLDISVENAPQLRDFYQKVIGWQVEEVSMGNYSDYSMVNPNTKEPVSGICHATGYNANMPAMWLPYFLVENAEQALNDALAMGAQQLDELKTMGADRFVVIKDPAGACCALYQRGA
ncbi:VOC family protein [Thalassotalea sp. LPB0316]|uniref:VOC family protein n=1 Tax=Thalassotalea sp. LPB0316 TaxID=2769490 RepID=UPI001867AEF2|nr:VOC family protein [Thalassotalea sp. LPB0316]QOL24360.1 VOC family protein [Thalassotalea sp. LPB0316]